MLSAPLWERALDLGLGIATHQGHQDIGQGLNDLRQHSRIEGEIHANLALAQKYSVSALIVFSGSRRTDLSDEEGSENMALGLRRVAHTAEQAGETLLLEMLNSKTDHPGYQCDGTAGARKSAAGWTLRTLNCSTISTICRSWKGI